MLSSAKILMNMQNTLEVLNQQVVLGIVYIIFDWLCNQSLIAIYEADLIDGVNKML